MLKITSFGKITRIDTARSFAGRGYYWTTAYLVDGLLVDSGCAASADELVAALKDSTIKHIINTHSHEDHIGANGFLQEDRTGLEILAHPSALRILANPREEQQLQLYRRLIWGWPKSSQAVAVSDGEVIKTSNHRFRVIYTPGHSPDHLCLYEPDEGWLFTGDLFNGSKDRAIRMDTDIWGIIASLKKIYDLSLSCLYPGCARVRDNPRQELSQKIVYLEEMGEKVLFLHRKGMSRSDIIKTLFPGIMLVELITMGHFSRWGFVNAFLQNKNQPD